MKKILISIIILLNILQVNISFGDSTEINQKITTAYNFFIKKLEKSSSIEKQIETLKKLNSIFENALKNLKYSKEKILLIEQFKILNLEKLKNTQLKLNLINNAKQDLYEKQLNINNENIFKKEYDDNSNINILNKYKILENFKYISYNKNNIFLENGIWYYYKFSEFKYFDNLNNVSLNDLSYNGISINKSLVFLNPKNNVIGFTTDFKKIKIIKDEIINGITNKYQTLIEIKDDKEFLYNDTDNLFLNLKNESIKLTKGLSYEEKIKAIYNYILENHEYSKIIDLSDKKIFSGIELYKNKEGVCEAYVKLFMYMLNFSGINNVEIIRGYVLDAQDFPQIGHAWVKIGDKYYDPTFDDPIGLTQTIKFDEYKYYGLEKDLFYTNRYNYEDLPEYLKTKDIKYRKLLIKKNLYNIYEKYKNFDYQLLKETKLKKENGINYNEEITLSNLNKITPLYEVRDYKFNKNGITFFIKKLNYYPINIEIIEILLTQIKYNFDGYYFFKWYLDENTFEYRIGYDLEL